MAVTLPFAVQGTLPIVALMVPRELFEPVPDEPDEPVPDGLVTDPQLIVATSDVISANRTRRRMSRYLALPIMIMRSDEKLGTVEVLSGSSWAGAFRASADFVDLIARTRGDLGMSREQLDSEGLTNREAYATPAPAVCDRSRHQRLPYRRDRRISRRTRCARAAVRAAAHRHRDGVCGAAAPVATLQESDE